MSGRNGSAGIWPRWALVVGGSVSGVEHPQGGDVRAELGTYLQANKTEEEQARSARHSTGEAVLAETAVLDFLYA